MINLSQYFHRIDYQGSPSPTLATLNAITAAHCMHIPFENIDVLQKRPIQITPEALFNKLVLQQRGGYCFEQNGLLLEVLRALDFQVEPLAGRVRLAAKTRAELPVRTHLLLKVTLANKDYITDVGVGSCSYTQALELVPDVLQHSSHDTRRFQYENGQWYLQVLYGDHWQDVYQFGGESMPFVDRKVASWYTSTSPDTHFTHDLIAAIANADGSRTSLKNNLLSIRQKNGDKQQFELENQSQLQAALKEHFGLNLDLDKEPLHVDY